MNNKTKCDKIVNEIGRWAQEQFNVFSLQCKTKIAPLGMTVPAVPQ